MQIGILLLRFSSVVVARKLNGRLADQGMWPRRRLFNSDVPTSCCDFSRNTFLLVAGLSNLLRRSVDRNGNKTSKFEGCHLVLYE